MARHRVSRLAPLAWGTLVLNLSIWTPLPAQTVDSIEIGATRFTVSGQEVEALPVDRASEVLPLQPGVTTNDQGELLVRGGQPGDVALYLDGVPILSAFRSRPFFGLSRSRVLESGIGVAPNAVESITLQTGPLPAGAGNGQAGVISIRTRQGVSRATGGLSFESDEPFGAGHSFGLNRFEGDVGGSIGNGVTFFAAGLLQGQRSLGAGFGSEEAPIFVRAGLDTTVAVPSAFNDPVADTTLVNIDNFAVSRGRCEEFAASTDPGIAGNFGLDCRGARTPSSALSTYDLLGKLTYTLGAGSRISLVALASQSQNRNFDYGNLHNPPGVTGNRASSNAVILGWHQALGSEGRPLNLEANLSFQSDRDRSGPLTAQGELDTADPFGGFMIGPLDLLFDFDNFPVDEELVRNYRTNLVGSRRSPYDLENPAQYSLIDRYRNNAYGLYNRDQIAPVTFPEAGGPVGLLTLYRENRALGSAALAWRPSPSHQLHLGGEFVRYSISNYSHLLESQSFSDVYIEHPIRGAAFIQDRVTLGEATITGGLRYDFYDSRARRPADFPRISSHPLFNPADPDAFFTNDAVLPQDKSHGKISPHIQASFRVTPRTVVRGGIASQPQVPDFRQILLRANTDLAITDASAVFGSDLDFERTTTFELGVRHDLAAELSLDLALYSRSMKSGVVRRSVQRFDPLTGTNRNLLVLTNDGTGKTWGLDAKLERQWGSTLSGWLAYSYQDATLEQPASAFGPQTTLPAPDSRPHAVSGAVALKVPGNWKVGSVAGAILRNVGVFTTFRVASGTPYTSCSPFSGDDAVLSPELCSTVLPEGINDSRLPTFKQLDFRLTKSFGPGGRFTGYLDARNLLNFKNVLAVFAVNGETSNPAEANANWVADSADLAGEATSSGKLLPDGSIDLGPGQSDPRLGCTTWADQAGNPAAPNCVYLIRAEERFGNGDHVFDLVEQRRASDALYRVVRGTQELTGPPRRVRVGLEVSF
jgi:hypothetical protein